MNSFDLFELTLFIFKLEDVLCVLKDAEGLMKLAGLSDAYAEVHGTMVHSLQLLHEALVHPGSVPNTHFKLCYTV